MARDGDDVADATLRVVTARGIGAATIARLRDAFGNDEAVVAATAKAIHEQAGVGTTRARRIREALASVDVDAQRRAMSTADTAMILAGDADYPPLLAAMPDAPAALRIRGALRAEDAVAVALVGARRCSAYGRTQADRFGAALAERGLAVVSGGARGVDAAAHRGAVRVGGRSIAVLGCGLDVAYPRGHEALFRSIVETGGAVISELPMGAGPRPGHFPRRNRIIAGLSLGVVVIEAATGSGSLITARIAADHGREVMVLPAPIDTPHALGGLQMAREGWAALVVRPNDVVDQIESSSLLIRGAFGRESSRVVADEGALSETERRIVEMLRRASGSVTHDDVTRLTQIDAPTVLAALTILEINGHVARETGGRLVLTR